MSQIETIEILLTESQVQHRIQQLADKISDDYLGKQIHIICVLKGAAFFACKLAQCISVPVSIDFLTVSSYGQGTKSQGVVKMIKDITDSLEGKEVLVVEDIVDSGRTLSSLLDILKQRNPASLRCCTLLDKPGRREVELDPDYNGFVIPDEFVVGYGLDYAQKYRNLPYVGILRLEEV
ncbi:MAG: hypoxanthine phosphoribosyltransferase [Clostridium sp.]|jgi:hypoxanthine phosphoribosyltransferase|nr:hypoxanthine phosphoribosyltransferase [Clostridium sp.]